MEDHKKMFFTQIPIEVEVVKPHFEVDTKTRMVDIINMKVNLMEVERLKLLLLWETWAHGKELLSKGA
jgi:hypothetical protein